MVIIKNNKNYSFDITPKTVIDNNSIIIKQGKYEEELNVKEIITLITLLSNLVIGKEIRICNNCGNKINGGKFCSECGERLY